MKLLISFLIFISFANLSDLDDVKRNYLTLKSVDEINNYILKIKNLESDEAKIYLAALYLMKAKHVKFPITKYSNFKRGSQLLDKTIDKNKNNIEYRYVRFLFQSEIPKFLGYNINKEEDFNLVIEYLEHCRLSSTHKKKMLTTMLKVSGLSGKQKQEIKKLNALL
jgi:hypothetical protein